jgi:hypothetical protein
MEPKEAGVPVLDTPKAAAYGLQAYSRLFGVQVLGTRRATICRCVCCGTRVTNRNLSGFTTLSSERVALLSALCLQSLERR